jgi:hypothetical protein
MESNLFRRSRSIGRRRQRRICNDFLHGFWLRLDGIGCRRVSMIHEMTGLLSVFLHRFEHLIVGSLRRILLALPGNLSTLVGMFGVTRRAPSEANVIAHHGDDRVIGKATFARAVIVDDVTEPKLTLLH